MRSTFLSAFGLIALLATGEAGAQGRVERRAAPAPSPPATSSPPSAPAPVMPDAPDPPPVLAPVAPLPAPIAVPETPAPLMPLTPPAPPVILPPLAVPVRPTPAPAPVAIVPGAPGSAAPIEGGWRITFGPGTADLNPVTAQAMRDFARGLAPQTTVTVSAFAPGAPEDPSTARRLSLARALAARGVLIAEGIASPRIIVRALGAVRPSPMGRPTGSI